MKTLRPQLSIREDKDNPNHHLWNNNGTWWCHYTVHKPDYTKKRIRCSLKTHILETAQLRRDRLFDNIWIQPTKGESV
ncbi:MAG TPA: hypothetical protein EYQ50_22400 [Verrucomicrobiales bacterium]|nr:hypothetical protein [Verrucomicrobiales bacterium]HIL70152.1 hypothetical protein [Verrucomicrobiota bacterium]